jgi:hypothetical protein
MTKMMARLPNGQNALPLELLVQGDELAKLGFRIPYALCQPNREVANPTYAMRLTGVLQRLGANDMLCALLQLVKPLIVSGDNAQPARYSLAASWLKNGQVGGNNSNQSQFRHDYLMEITCSASITSFQSFRQHYPPSAGCESTSSPSDHG